MGDIFRCQDPVDLLYKQAPQAIYIGWYWQKYNTSVLPYFIYTHENALNIYHDPKRTPGFLQLHAYKNRVPLLLRANDEPDVIGQYKKDIVYDYCYMGWSYCHEMVPSSSFQGIYHATVNHANFYDYEKRKNIYLSSVFALGFQSNINIGYQHVSQRIYEGLAYGCIVLTNSLPACEQTDWIAVHVKTREDVEKQMHFYISNPEEREKKQKQGYEFIQKQGTNFFAIQQFRDFSQKEWQIDL
jgi:hypothetical protein